VLKPKKLRNLAMFAAFLAVTPAFAQQTENYKNLIEKARNLTLQRDRLQASQVLQRAIQKEPKTSQAYKEMTRALDELMLLFYTEKGQSLFTQADAAADSNPKAAIDSYQSALRAEDGNVSVLKALSRAHLRLEECDKADTYIKQAEAMNPFSPEVKLLRLQALNCSGMFTVLSQQLTANAEELSSVEK
jgi:tetratricopeptide (TPR) repeat protein